MVQKHEVKNSRNKQLMDFQWHVTLRYKVKSHPTLPCPTWGMNYLFVGSIHAVYVVHLWLSHFMAISLLHGLSQDTHSVSGELLVLIGNNQEQWCWQLCYSIVLLQLFSVTVISCQSLVVPNWRIKCYCRCVCVELLHVARGFWPVLGNFECVPCRREGTAAQDTPGCSEGSE